MPAHTPLYPAPALFSGTGVYPDLWYDTGQRWPHPHGFPPPVGQVFPRWRRRGTPVYPGSGEYIGGSYYPIAYHDTPYCGLDVYPDPTAYGEWPYDFTTQQ